MARSKVLLNLGCGQRFHPAWTNVDFSSKNDQIISHDLTQGIPFPDNSYQVVYHSHLLEHFSRLDAKLFLQECYRVLHPQGILRIVVPDLEQIVKSYLSALSQARLGSDEGADSYNWMMLELYDQAVRHYSGGEMASYIFQDKIPNKAFVIERLGIAAKNAIARHQEKGPSHQNTYSRPPLYKRIYRLLTNAHLRKETFKKILLGEEYKALQIGRFRLQGEIHQWMYDSYSLQRLLEQCGFQNVAQQTATKSRIPDWTDYNLDSEPDGTTYKADSLFMEATKPV